MMSILTGSIVGALLGFGISRGGAANKPTKVISILSIVAFCAVISFGERLISEQGVLSMMVATCISFVVSTFLGKKTAEY